MKNIKRKGLGVQKRSLFKLLAALSLPMVSQLSFGASYEWCGNIPKKWSSGAYALYAAPVSFPTSGPYWPALQTVVQRMKDNPSDFYLNVYQGSNSNGFDNGRSEIWFTPDPSATPAIAYNWSVCTASTSYIYEVDVQFYSGINYTASMDRTGLWGYGGNARPFQTTAVHELGHTAGLMHVNSEYNIMGTDYYHIHANGNTTRSYLGEDAADGLVYLYGYWNQAKEDVSLAHWKRVGSSGQYSKHGHTQMFDASGSLLASVNDTSCSKGCEQRYLVNAGDTVQLELTAENNGRSTVTPTFAYYISTNNSITTADTLLTTESFAIGRNDVYTYKKTLTIPANLASGDYWIGAIVNHNNAITESTMENNAMSTPIRVSGSSSNLPPTAVANGPYSGTVGNPVSFNGAGSNDPDGVIQNYTWDFGDGNSANGVQVNHTYANEGNYSVTLTVTDDLGMTGTEATSANITLTGGGGTLPDACASQSPVDYVELSSGVPVCVIEGGGAEDYIYFYFRPENASRVTIRTDNGTGNADLYYSASTWPEYGLFDQASTGATNQESITVNNPANDWHYIMIDGEHIGLTLQIDVQ